MKKIIAFPLCILIIALLILFFYFRHHEKKLSLKFDNILLITIDTIRADHLSCYGYDKIKTVNIDAIAEQGIVFTKAFCQVPLTLPSHTSIMTGLFPNHHGVRNNGTYIFDKKSETLANVLKSKGYKTAAFVSSYVLDKHFGLNYGFDTYNDEVQEKQLSRHIIEAERDAKQVSEKALEWLRSNYNDKFFMWIHYYDPHAPYAPPKQYLTKVQNLYDGEILYVDEQIGVIINFLKENNIYSKTLIIIIGDHGEAFGEHNEREHGMFLYDTTVHIPFIMKFPRLKTGQKIKSAVRSVDLFPTILDIMGINYKNSDGKSLVEVINNPGGKDDTWNYSETLFPLDYKWSPLYSIRTKEWKLIDAPKPELYNLIKDPDEKDNIFDAYPKKANELKSLLESVKSNEKSAAASYIDKETREKLQALGYVSTYSKIDNTSKLPDPKDKINFWYRIRKARTLLNSNPDEAIRLLLELHNEDTYTANYAQVLAIYYQNNKDYDNAIFYINEAIKRNNTNYLLWYDLACSYAKKGMINQAKDAVEMSISLSNSNPESYNLRGTIYIYQNLIEDAIKDFNKALELDPYNSSALSNIGNIHLMRKEIQQAKEFYEKAINYNNKNSDALNGLGVIAMFNRDYAKAIDYFKSVLKEEPEFYECYFNIAICYINLRDYWSAKKYLEALLEVMPSQKYPQLYRQATQIIEALSKEIGKVSSH
jgi:arylsulfatase A-like enzyme/Tfp pilus assembly protein PilF